MSTNPDADAEPKRKRGRPKGTINRLARESREAARATGELPHEFLLRVSRGEVITRQVLQPDGSIAHVQEEYDFEARKDAAKAAAPYFAPKISTVEVIRGVEDDELDAIIKELAAQTGIGIGTGGEESEDEEEERPRSRPRTPLR